MERIKIKITEQQIFVALITLFFFILPFFWFKPGEMDLGGDSSRLYFYDPIAYLKNYAFYGISPSAFGTENIGYFMLPFVSLLVGLKFLFNSPTVLIAFFHGISLSIAFITCYAIVKELVNTTNPGKKNIAELAAIVSGLVYVFSPSSILGWDKVLVTHNQFFLNPLMFFLLLKYFKTDKTIFLALALITTFIFAPNFSFVAAPGFFAFYPLSLTFLFLYKVFILKTKVNWIPLIFSFLAFVSLHLLHILPQLVSMFSPGSVLNTTVFSTEGKFDRGLSYFVAIAPNIKVSLNIMNLPQMIALQPFAYLFICFSIIITLGLLFNRKKVLLLSGFFFLIVLFFASANITTIGFEVYKKLFDIPGFSMFRNFYGQWGYSLLFFYTILFGQAFALVLDKISIKKGYFLTLGLALVLTVGASSFINGSLVNKVIWKSNNVYVFMKMDPQYEDLLDYVRSLPTDGKILTLPLTDPGYQIVSGTNGGAYQGPSTISYLAGKQDFAGTLELGLFKDEFSLLIERKDYKKLKELLGLLNIKYVFYNADPGVYEGGFPTFPYVDARKYLPKTQKEYKEFLNEFGLKQIKNIDNKYFVFELDTDFYQSKIFTSNEVHYFTKEIDKWSLPFSFDTYDKQIIFIEAPQAPTVFSETYNELDKRNIFTQIVKNPDLPRFLHNAFAKTSPSSMLYKPSVVKEYFDLQKKTSPDYFIDNRMFLSAKLLFELEQWGHDMDIFDNSSSVENAFSEMKKVDKERTLSWELQYTNNTWESLLTRYVRNYVESIDYLEQSSEGQQWKDQKKFLMNEYIINHKQRFNNIILGSNMSSDEKTGLNKLLDGMFDHWLEELYLPDLREPQNEYIIPATDKELLHTLYIKKEDFEKFDQTQFGLQIDGKELIATADQDETQWVKLDTTGIDFSKENIVSITYKNSKNLINTSEVISLQSSDGGGILSQSKLQNGLLLKINDWEPNNFYLLSFDYLNPDAPFAVKLYEAATNDTIEIEALQLLKNQLKSNKWTRYQAVVKSGNGLNDAFLQIERDVSENPLATFKIKNMSLTNLPQPQLLVKTVRLKEQVSSQPKLNITKINPTKYKVTVTDSRLPYYLVLNQAFNNRWKVFLDKSENVVPRQLFDFSFWETYNKKPLFEGSHYAVNGGINAWYIDPKEVGNKQSYTLILEFTTQRYFYIGFTISLIMFVVVILFTIYRLLKHEK